MPSRRPFACAFIPATALPSVSAVSCGCPSFSATTAAHRVRTGARLTLTISPRFAIPSRLVPRSPPRLAKPLDEEVDQRPDARGRLAAVRVHGVDAELGVAEGT